MLQGYLQRRKFSGCWHGFTTRSLVEQNLKGRRARVFGWSLAKSWDAEWPGGRLWRCVPHELEAEKRMKCGAQQVVSNKRQMLYDALDCLFASLRVCLLVCLVGSCWFLFVYVLTVFSFPASTCNLKFQSALDCGLDAAKLWVQVLSAVRAHQGHRDWASNDSQVTGCSFKTCWENNFFDNTINTISRLFMGILYVSGCRAWSQKRPCDS